MTADLGLPIIARQLTADLALLALKAADLPAYLQAHGKLLQMLIRPRGLGYAMLAAEGGQLAYHLSHNLSDLTDPKEGVEGLADTFSRTLLQVLKTGKSLTLKAEEGAGSYDHIWEPCIVKGRVLCILHFWFESKDALLPFEARQKLLAVSAREVELYAKLQGLSDLSSTIGQSASHVQLLEELSGEQDLESIGWDLVNYARESLKCSRVSLIAAKDVGDSPSWLKARPIEERSFVLQACSGLKKVNKRAEQSVLLASLAKDLVGMALKNTTKESTASAQNEPHKIVLGLAQRESRKHKQRSAIVEHYFERVPMNWAIALPLYGRKGVMMGLLLFEGQTIPPNLALNVLRMRALAHAGGYAVASALQWEKQWMLKLSRKWEHFLSKANPTWRRMMAKKWALGLMIVVAIFLFPFQYRVKGSAVIWPANEAYLPAYRPAILKTRFVAPGQWVKEGELLVSLDTEELRSGLSRAEEELFQAQAAMGRARINGDERLEMFSRVRAQAALANVEAIQLALDQSFVRAPFAGLLTGPAAKQLKRGTVVNAGQVLAIVADPMVWNVQVNLREQDMIRLEDRLLTHGSCEAKLSLLATPSETYPLLLDKPEQLSYGTEPLQDSYNYFASFILKVSPEEGTALRRDYVGDVSIYAGWQTLAQLLFHDFIIFCKLRW